MPGNVKAWLDNATPEEVEILVRWVEENYDAEFDPESSSFYNSEGAKLCDCCYQPKIGKVYSTVCGGADVCKECDDALLTGMELPRYVEKAEREGYGSLTKYERSQLRTHDMLRELRNRLPHDEQT